jgi:hypothetical protein
MSIKNRMISFSNKGKSISPGLLFCNFVRNTIYVIKIEMFEPVFMVRYLKFEDITFYNFLHNKQNCIITG